MTAVIISCRDTDLGLCGLAACPPLERIARPGGRDAPASPSPLTDSPAVGKQNDSHPIRPTASARLCSGKDDSAESGDCVETRPCLTGSALLALVIWQLMMVGRFKKSQCLTGGQNEKSSD